MKYVIIMLLTMTVFFTSCGNVEDTDGRIGNENKETENTENIKDRAEDVIDDAKEKLSDMKDALTANADVITRLTTEQAQAAALSDAGYSHNEVTFYKTYLHNNSGRVYYDVEFASLDVMYEYEIDSTTGDILLREESSIK